VSRGRAATADHEEGEGYYASISDLMVGILFIFLLMLTVFALNFRDAEQDQLVQRERYERQVELTRSAEERARQAEARAVLARRDAEEAERRAVAAAEEARRQTDLNARLRDLLRQAVDQLQSDVESRQAARAQLLDTLQRSLEARGVRVEVDQRSGVLRLAGDLLFRSGSAELEDRARTTVAVLAEALADALPCYAYGGTHDGSGCIPILETVLVEGHTDRQPWQGRSPGESLSLNDRLSAARALEVFTEIRRVRDGLEMLRNPEDLPLLGISGYGQRRPLADAQGPTEADFRRNRRIDLRFVLSSRTSEEIADLRRRLEELLREADAR
jgi:chemotaxis protein MotB